MKKIIRMLLCSFMAISLVACGQGSSIGQKEEEFSDIFTDRKVGNKSSYVAYNFSLEEYGSTKVYVDTTDGHKFELQAEDAGFDIVDKDGEVVLRARAMNSNGYDTYSAMATNTREFNGREFNYMIQDDVFDAFLYLNEVGIDAGMVFDVPSGDSSILSLIAFRGTPVEKGSVNKGSSTDDSKDSIKTSTIPKDAQDFLATIQTDYKKVNWGVEYNLSEDYPGLVISVTPIDDDSLLVGLTNLYDGEISVSGDVSALDASGNEVGSSFIYEDAIGPGNTAVTVIFCDGMPDGRLHWSDVEIKDGTSTYIPWEADYAGKQVDDYSIEIDYEAASVHNEDMSSFEIYAVLLDSNGFVLGYGTDYYFDEVKAGSKAKGKITVYLNSDFMDKVADVAIFANPTVY